MAGVPVVACDFPEIKKVVQKEKTGIIVDSHDSGSIAEGVNQLLANPGLRSELSKNCRKASGIYNWLKEKERFIAIYETMRGRKA